MREEGEVEGGGRKGERETSSNSEAQMAPRNFPVQEGIHVSGFEPKVHFIDSWCCDCLLGRECLERRHHIHHQPPLQQ